MARNELCTAVAAQVTATEVGFNNPVADPPEFHPVLRALWHRQSSVVAGVEYLRGDARDVHLDVLDHEVAWHRCGTSSEEAPARAHGS
jgi:hypothetical protein